MDPEGWPPGWIILGLPRLRGDGPADDPIDLEWSAVAPPTRGWTHLIYRRSRQAYGCPAYAGMDLSPYLPPILSKRLPRLRGDGPVSHAMSAATLPVAPPTRGWTPSRNRTVAGSLNGCPAYAGMDPQDSLLLPAS